MEPPKRRSGESASAFRVPDFVVGTDKAYIVACAASAFEEIDSERRCEKCIVQKPAAAKLARAGGAIAEID